MCPKCRSHAFCLYPFCLDNSYDDAAWNWYYNVLSEDKKKDINKKYSIKHGGLREVLKAYRNEKA